MKNTWRRNTTQRNGPRRPAIYSTLFPIFGLLRSFCRVLYGTYWGLRESWTFQKKRYKNLIFLDGYFGWVFFTHDVTCVNLTLATLVPTFFVLISHFLTLAQLWQVTQVWAKCEQVYTTQVTGKCEIIASPVDSLTNNNIAHQNSMSAHPTISAAQAHYTTIN